MTPGQVAFEKWVSLLDLPMWADRWDALTESAQAGWEEVALAAINKHIDDGEGIV